jgi:hypothetical protein
MSKWPEKFDIIVANPPYGDKRNTNLHFAFLEKSWFLSKGDVVFVHPSNNFITSVKKNREWAFSEKNIKSLELFNGNGIFNINKFFPLSITHLTSNKSDIGFELKYRDDNLVFKDAKISEVLHIPPDPIIDSIKNKINPKISIQNKLKHRKKDNVTKKFIVPLPGTRGHVRDFGRIYKEDFFTFISSECEPVEFTKENEIPYHWIEFDSLEESKNFIIYLKQFFTRFSLSILKFNNALNSSMHFVPWMDFSQEWTDEKLYTHFNITEEEQRFIRSVIPSYY